MQNPHQREDTIEACGDIAWKRQVGDEWYLGLRLKFINKVDKSDILDVAYDIDLLMGTILLNMAKVHVTSGNIKSLFLRFEFIYLCESLVKSPSVLSPTLM